MRTSAIGHIDKAGALSQACQALFECRNSDAVAILTKEYPFVAIEPVKRSYTARQCMRVFRRDGFIDQYSGNLLIFPGTLRLLSKLLPAQFPFHKNWKLAECHFAYYELFPTIDHLVPISRGGVNESSNLVTTSMLRNAAKGNFTLEELGWEQVMPDNARRWDGLTKWFLEYIERDPKLITDDPYLQNWHKAAVSEFRV